MKWVHVAVLKFHVL